MSDAFFNKLFGDSQSTKLGTGWVSGTASVFFGLLGLGGVITLHFPGLLTLPEAREFYPIDIMRMLIQAMIAAALVLGAISAILRERKVLGLTGVFPSDWLRRCSAVQARPCRKKSHRKSASALTGFSST